MHTHMYMYTYTHTHTYIYFKAEEAHTQLKKSQLSHWAISTSVLYS